MTTSGNIAAAVQWMKEGLKVRRANWLPGTWVRMIKTNWGLHIDGNHPENSMYTFCSADNLIAEDWEVYKD